jgi:hypothetical protein
MSVEDTNALLAAVAMASQDAAARIQAAETAAKAQVDAAVQSTTLTANAETQIAQTEASWHQGANEAQVNAAQVTADANKEAAIQSAQADADARRDAAESAAQATIEAAHAEAEAHRAAATSAANATTQAASTDANARTQAAQAQATATVEAAQAQANAEVSAAGIRAAADQAVAALQSSYQTAVAGIDAAARVNAAVAAANAETAAAASRAAAEIAAAQAQVSNQVSVAQIDANARTTVATTSGQFQVQAAGIEAGARTASATAEADAQRYSADRQLAGVTAHESAETNRLDKKLGFANDKFAILAPLLDQIVNAGTGFLNNFQTPQGFNPNIPSPPQAPLGFRASSVSTVQAGDDQRGYYQSYGGPPTMRMGDLDPPHDGGQGAGGSTTGTITITAPYIATRGVFTPAMLQQQVNQAYARNDSRTQALIRKSQGDLAGRGFSSTSPILEALKVGYITSNLRASIEAASQIRLAAAQANVDAVFRGQNARSEQYIQQEQVVIEAEKNQIQRQVGVLNAVAQLVGGIL